VRWLKRLTVDEAALHRVATQGTVAEFDAVYDPALATHTFDHERQQTLLMLVLRHRDPATRVVLANRLLDDGADVRVGVPLHVMGALVDHDPAEPALLRRMLDQGADVNLVNPGDGTPLERFAVTFAVPEVELVPFYDVLLARDDLDLLRPSRSGRPVFLTLLKWREQRPVLVARCERLLADRGIDPPTPD
jgi:hypothetical protein